MTYEILQGNLDSKAIIAHLNSTRGEGKWKKVSINLPVWKIGSLTTSCTMFMCENTDDIVVAFGRNYADRLHFGGGDKNDTLLMKFHEGFSKCLVPLARLAKCYYTPDEAYVLINYHDKKLYLTADAGWSDDKTQSEIFKLWEQGEENEDIFTHGMCTGEVKALNEHSGWEDWGFELWDERFPHDPHAILIAEVTILP